ncbi:MAG: hypothetical protein ACLFSQ_06465 [Candidatus Zixiibacteriota bacterium]
MKESYIWTYHPAAENLLRTTLAIIVIIVSALVSAYYMEHVFFGFLALFVLFIGLGSYFFPTKYGVNEKGVVKEIVGQKWGKPWKYFRRKAFFDDGVLLSPLAKDSVLDKFRGWFLPTKNKEVRDFIREMMNNE